MYTYVNLLTPAGDATNIDNLQSSTFVGLDSEAWNLAVQAQSHDAHGTMGNGNYLGGEIAILMVQTPCIRYCCR
jgi:hypothetical protein